MLSNSTLCLSVCECMCVSVFGWLCSVQLVPGTGGGWGD